MNIAKLKSVVRRLSPVECSRLMGFPDDYLFIGGGKDGKTPDSPVYKACGNSWGVNSARWVNSRIEKVLRDTGIVGDRTIRYGTTCSGIEAHSLSVRGLDWQPYFFSEIEPFPCKVLAARYPNVPNLGDMTHVDGSQFKLDVFSGGTPCFVAGTMILTPSGYRPIEDLRVGDEVVSGSGAIRKVEKAGTKKAVVGELHVVGRPNFICTPDHPFFAVEMKRDNRRSSNTYGKKIPVGDYEVCRAEDSVGKYVGRIAPSSYTEDFRDEFVAIAGWYVGDGYIRRWEGKSKKAVVFALCSKHKIDAFVKEFGDKFNLSISKDGRVTLCNTKLAEWLVYNFGEHADSKRIPYWLYAHPAKDRFLDGYRATYGCERDTHFKYSTVSKALAHGIADLVGNASIHFHETSDCHIIYGREVRQKDYYVVQETKGDTPKTKMVNGRWASVASSWHCDGNAVADVYNIQVSEEHTYVVEGIWSHNCQSFSVAGKRHGLGGSTDWNDTTTRSSLAFHWVRIGLETGAPILLWENVPGVYSSSEGRDFPWLLHFLNEHGYSVAWRTLDTQWIAVDDFPLAIPQRRRRCWLVAFHGDDWRIPAKIMFERQDRLGKFEPNRIVNGVVVNKDVGNEPMFVQDDLFGSMADIGPAFDMNSRADDIPWDILKDEVSVARVCGKIGYAGNIFFGGVADAENISPLLRENIGNAGICTKDYIVTMKTPEWSAGIQLPNGGGCPDSYKGFVNGLSDILHPMATEEDFSELLRLFLSAKACTGILNRAGKRGKKLPDRLENALHLQIASWANGLFGDCIAADEEDGGESEGDGDEAVCSDEDGGES